MKTKVILTTVLLAAAVLIYGISTVLTGCKGKDGELGATGPAGTDGINGTDGTNGVAGNVTCLVCHSGSVKALIALQFATSQHALGDIAVDYAGGRSTCAKCHSHEGYVEFAMTGGVAENFSAPSAWKCSTCHSLHTTFEGTDYAFRLGGAITLITDGTTIVDNGNSNTCMNCHQSRKNDDSYDNATTDQTYTRTFTGDDIAIYTNAAVGTGGSITLNGTSDTLTVIFDVPVATHVYISSTHAGPHHGPQTNTWAGVGGITSSAGTPYSAHSGGCVSCHMDGSNHSFMPKSATCIACHNSSTDKGTEMGLIADRIQAVGDELEVRHAVHYEEGWHPVYASITRAEFQAFWNFMICLEDRSNSAHNPTYVKAMLTEAEATLGL